MLLATEVSVKLLNWLCSICSACSSFCSGFHRFITNSLRIYVALAVIDAFDYLEFKLFLAPSRYFCISLFNHKTHTIWWWWYTVWKEMEEECSWFTQDGSDTVVGGEVHPCTSIVKTIEFIKMNWRGKKSNIEIFNDKLK